MRPPLSKERASQRSVALAAVPWPAAHWKQILLVEDNSSRAQRRIVAGVGPSRAAVDVVLRLHKITPKGILLVGERSYRPGTLNDVAGNRGRAALALELLDEAKERSSGTLVVAGPSYGGSTWFIEELNGRGFDWVVELPRRTSVRARGSSERVWALDMLANASWKPQTFASPVTGQRVHYAVADLGRVFVSGSENTARLFAAQSGAIQGLHNGTVIGLSSARTARPPQLLRALGWTRWIRVLDRQYERSLSIETPYQTPAKNPSPIKVSVRSNITLARQQDEEASRNGDQHNSHVEFRGELKRGAHVLNVVELFAGAGGMGLGFLLAGGNNNSYRLTFSGEVHPVYVETLRRNHDELKVALKNAPLDVVPEWVQPRMFTT